MPNHSPSIDTPPAWRHAGFSGRIGVTQADITPPIGIYARNWGAATHDAADGIHRPLVLNALTLRADDEAPLVLIDGDLGWWQTTTAFQSIQSRLLKQFSLKPEQLIFALSHTHASATLTDAESDLPGSELLGGYLEQICQAASNAIGQALSNERPASLEWHVGKCQLAAVRDLKDPNPETERVICGFDPGQKGDDTLVVGRVTSASGELLATLVNYACHPTTLAWGNSAISPDYVGAMRETIQQNRQGAPAFFLQGASGELSPRMQYVGDTQIADQHGRQLGFAALATLEDMQPANTELAFDRVVDSGAPLAVWKNVEHVFPSTVQSVQGSARLPLKNWPSADELEQARLNSTDRAEQERLRRKRDIRQALGDGTHFDLPVWGWRMGEAILIGTMGEAYSAFQTELRNRFPQLTIVCMNLINGAIGYLPPASKYDLEIYQVMQTPFGRGSLETVIEESARVVEQLTAKEA